MADERYDVAIVGGGILGVATAFRLTREHPDRKLILFEKEDRLAAHQTGRNSGVIHSGVYYPPGSVKARTCVAGARMLKDFCREEGVPFVECGKVIVATDASELAALDEIHRRGLANGVPGLAMIGAERLREIEPHVQGIRALHVPQAAVVDYGAVVEKMAALSTKAGAVFRTRAAVIGLRDDGDAVVVETPAGAIRASLVIGCAGLRSDRLARLHGLDPGVCIVPFRGEYYELVPGRGDLCRGLIYPVPDPAFPFLGVHLTRGLDGRVLAGPNAVLAFCREGYKRWQASGRDLAEVLRYPGFRRLARRYWRTGLEETLRSLSQAAFADALARLVPEIEEEDLVPARSGVRAQALSAAGELVDDFVIVEAPRALHVCNAPSPAATACLAIAGEIVKRVAEAVFTSL
jgi:L-2-hydroxyglutarate oxidase